MSHSDAVDYRELAFEHGRMCFDAVRVGQPSPALFDPGNPELGAKVVGQGGRQAAWFVDGDFGRAVLRHYRRGGAVARISRDRYLWCGAVATRSMAEFRTLSSMRAQGLPVPRPLAAAYWKTGLLYRAAILIERIEQARTLTELVHASPEVDTERVRTIAETIHAMHEAGFWHADLNAYNILLDRNDKVWLIDLDKAITGTVSPSRRFRNLKRLRRSLRKVAPHNADLWWKGINDAYNSI